MLKRRGRILAAVVAFTAVAGLSTASQAGVTFTLGNNPEPNEENVLFTGSATSGTTLQGTSNQSHVGVGFSSSQTLYVQGGGQASITASNQNPNTTDITGLTIAAPGYTFTDFIMNMLNGHGNATVTANTSASGAVTFNTTLGNGQNFLTVLATGSDTISSLSIAADGFQTFSQPRISGLSNGTTPPGGSGVPEPASVGIAGLGLLALGLLRRRKRI